MSFDPLDTPAPTPGAYPPAPTICKHSNAGLHGNNHGLPSPSFHSPMEREVVHGGPSRELSAGLPGLPLWLWLCARGRQPGHSDRGDNVMSTLRSEFPWQRLPECVLGAAHRAGRQTINKQINKPTPVGMMKRKSGLVHFCSHAWETQPQGVIEIVSYPEKSMGKWGASIMRQFPLREALKEL